jgi:hypothetical protein
MMSKRIGVTIATLLAAGGIGLAGLTGAASGSERQIASAGCPENCLAIFQPVTCKMSDGDVLTFGNRCEADVFACKNGLKIRHCRPAYA